MSANCGQLNSNEDSEVMVRQVNLAAAFHDHISCTKMSQHSIGSGICGLPSANMSDQPNATIGSMNSDLPTAFESDHMYATESKSYNDNNISNGCAIRANSLFNNNLSDERNQISKLTEMILGQLDLIQHQQEQLLKKDRQLQGLKQDREALCLRLEKMEKRIAVLSAKVANNAAQTAVSANTNSISVNNVNNNSINVNRTLVNNNSQTVSIGVETDCDQSGSDTIVEETNSGGGLLADPTVFSKLYSNTSAVNSCSSSVNSVKKSTITAKSKPVGTPSLPPVAKIKETNETKEAEKSSSITTSSLAVRKSRKRPSEVMPTTSSSSVSTPNKKRSKPSIASDITSNDDKKDILSAKETSCDSMSALSTTQTNNTSLTKSFSNRNKVVKLKSETSSRVDATHSTSSSLNLNFKNISVTKDVLMTSKPYPIAVNNSQSPLELLSDADIAVDSKSNCEEKSNTSDLDVIEVPSWRLHPVSSCYSLEGTEVCLWLTLANR